MTTIPSQADETMWREIRPRSTPARVSGTEVTSPSEDPVTATTAEAMRYA